MINKVLIIGLFLPFIFGNEIIVKQSIGIINKIKGPMEYSEAVEKEWIEKLTKIMVPIVNQYKKVSLEGYMLKDPSAKKYTRKFYLTSTRSPSFNPNEIFNLILYTSENSFDYKNKKDDSSIQINFAKINNGMNFVLNYQGNIIEKRFMRKGMKLLEDFGFIYESKDNFESLKVQSLMIPYFEKILSILSQKNLQENEAIEKTNKIFTMYNCKLIYRGIDNVYNLHIIEINQTDPNMIILLLIDDVNNITVVIKHIKKQTFSTKISYLVIPNFNNKNNFVI